MPVTNDESALRAALHDATLGQPEAPVDRIGGVRRRHVRRRAVQGGVAVAAVMAAVAGVLTSVGGAGAPARPQPLKQPPPKSWQLTWPLRYGDSSDVAVAHGNAMQRMAIAYYESKLGPAVRDKHVLYSGRPSGMSVEWVVFEGSAGSPETHQLLALASTDDGASWSSYTMQAPPLQVRALGFAVGAQVFALAAPPVRTVGYLDLSSGSTFASPQVPIQHGAAVLNARHVVRPNTLYVGDRYDSPFPVWWRDGISGAGRLRAWQKALQSPAAGLRYLGFLAGSGSGSTASLRAPQDGTLVLILRCAGPAGLRVEVGTPYPAGEQDQDGCDGRSSPADASLDIPVLRGQKLKVSPRTSEFTVFAVGIYLKP